VCVLLEFLQKHGDTYYEPTIVVHDKTDIHIMVLLTMRPTKKPGILDTFQGGF